ncbi:SDR family NAD(P)-dependent oxidoreductase, partial [Clostridioides difficile]|nr:SDR family NAD(P)-dependent oxidoreductase [Clostridioides difficile]
ARVGVNGRSEAAVQSALTHLRAAVPDAGFDGIAADLSDAAGVARITQHTPAADILVNNAGIVAPSMPLADMPADRLRRMFDTNV